MSNETDTDIISETLAHLAPDYASTPELKAKAAVSLIDEMYFNLEEVADTLGIDVGDQDSRSKTAMECENLIKKIASAAHGLRLERDAFALTIARMASES